MRIAGPSYFALACCLLLAACAKTSGGQTGDEDAIGGNEFYEKIHQQAGFGNYRPAYGLSDLVPRSERIVLAHAVALRAGRRFVLPSGDDTTTMETIVLELAVDRAFKGPDETLYLEFYAGSAEANIQEHVPDDRVIAFANRATATVANGGTIEGSGDGLAKGATLFHLTTPQGFALAAKDGSFTQPFEPSDGVLGNDSFDALVGRVAQATAEDAAMDASMPATDASTPATDASSAAPDATASPDGSAGCPGEGATQCSAECFAVTATPYDQTNNCLAYNAQIVIGCNDGIGPPIIACIERISDGQMFTLGGGNPYPMSTVYRACSDQTTDIFSAPACP